MGTLRDRVLTNIKERRNRVLEGKINCIPSPYTRFREDFVGIEQGRYYLITAPQKCGKTQFTSYTFIYEPLWYCYHNSDKANIEIFYYPLEENAEEILLRYMSFILFRLSQGKYRISTMDLKSTDERKVLPEEILSLLESEEYTSLIDYFEEHVHFMDSRNPTGCWKDMVNYANTHGTIHKKKVEYVDKLTGEIKTTEKFDYYEPYDSKTYVMWLWDHAGLTEQERGLDLRQSINKLSEYFVLGRNLYNFIPVLIYQQSQETQNLEAFKSNKIKSSVSGLSDSKYPARDCSLMLGLTNPYSHEIPTYYNYDITKLKGNFRLLEVIVNRHGNSNGVVGLFFDGCCCNWKELPKPNDVEELDKWYNYLDKIREVPKITNTKNILFFTLSKNYIKRVGSSKIKQYFCTLFRKIQLTII